MSVKKGISFEEVAEGRTYRNNVNCIIKINSIDKKTKFMKIYNVSEACNSFIYYRDDYFIELIR